MSLDEISAIVRDLAAGTVVVVPKQPSHALLVSIATRLDHSFGIQNMFETEEQWKRRQEMLLADAVRAHEEVVGAGFYHPDRAAFYNAAIKDNTQAIALLDSWIAEYDTNPVEELEDNPFTTEIRPQKTEDDLIAKFEELIAGDTTPERAAVWLRVHFPDRPTKYPNLVSNALAKAGGDEDSDS